MGGFCQSGPAILATAQTGNEGAFAEFLMLCMPACVGTIGIFRSCGPVPDRGKPQQWELLENITMNMGSVLTNVDQVGYFVPVAKDHGKERVRFVAWWREGKAEDGSQNELVILAFHGTGQYLHQACLLCKNESHALFFELENDGFERLECDGEDGVS